MPGKRLPGWRRVGPSTDPSIDSSVTPRLVSSVVVGGAGDALHHGRLGGPVLVLLCSAA